MSTKGEVLKVGFRGETGEGEKITGDLKIEASKAGDSMEVRVGMEAEIK